MADVKPTDPEQHMGNFQIQPAGRLIAKGMPMRFLLNRAFNTNNNDEIGSDSEVGGKRALRYHGESAIGRTRANRGRHGSGCADAAVIAGGSL